MTGSPVLDKQLNESLNVVLEQNRSRLPALYKKEAEQKDWDSAHQVDVALMTRLGEQKSLW